MKGENEKMANIQPQSALECLTYKAISLSMKQDQKFTNVTDIKITDAKILIWENEILSAILHGDAWEIQLVKEDGQDV